MKTLDLAIEKRYREAEEHLVPINHLAPNWSAARATDPEIARLIARHSSIRESRHKTKPGSCWAYFATCMTIRPLGKSCCDGCENRAPSHRTAPSAANSPGGMP